jgi:EAL domain-containing protein (putative c-di-GMP-specific phosphodiesterase class I)/GGDEF domain-containing protein/CBS domain-containing protein
VSDPLSSILELRQITTSFQPIVDGSGSAVGYEALSRGPEGSLLHSPLDLFTAAHRAGHPHQLDLLCIELALSGFARAGLSGRLFLNVLPQTLLEDSRFPAWLRTQLARSGCKACDIVIEITEHGLERDALAVSMALEPLRALGCEIAIDDLGCGASGLRTWCEIRPDYVKIDGSFISDIDRDPVSAEVLRSVLDMAHTEGSRVIVEGVETAAQCASVVDLGVDYLQGFFFGRPEVVPHVEASAKQLLAATRLPGHASCAEQLATLVPPIAPATRVAEVAELFRGHKEWDSLAVVREGKPIGIVRRDDLLTLLSRPLYPELFNRKPITEAMDAHPLIIDAHSRLEHVSRLVTSSTRARVNEEFIIARDGRYVGLGRTIDLLRQITEQQIQAAKQSNPLTMLPGNRQIEEQVARLLALRSEFLLCHVDLDHFKPYNDEYGYARGDQLLLHVAELLKRCACPRIDFVGHLGGDDFILLMRNTDWRERLASVFQEFDAAIPGFYSAEHWQAGGIHGVDRDGRTRSFPIMTLSIGAVQACGERFTDANQTAEHLRRVKSHAKAKAGHALFVDNGHSVAALDIQQLARSRGSPVIGKLATFA